VKDKNGNTLGSVRANGDIVDKNGNKLGNS